jgi:RHS repeat-associated protein
VIAACKLSAVTGDQRYYNPWFGRFNTPDPTFKNVDLENPGSFNLYAYVNGDPVNSNDPTGTFQSVCSVDPFNPICSAPGIGSIFGGDPGIMYPINESFWDRKAAELANKREALDHAKSLLGDAEDLANDGILKSDCFGLFGSRSDGLTAAQVLAGMESGTAKIQFVYNPNDTSVATTRPTISLGNVFGVSSTVTKINAGQDSRRSSATAMCPPTSRMPGPGQSLR